VLLLQLASATLGMACYLVSNALVVSPAACSDAATRRAIYWLAFIRWSMWNTTFLLTTIKVRDQFSQVCCRAATARGTLEGGFGGPGNLLSGGVVH
jgi:hypothetical protein